MKLTKQFCSPMAKGVAELNLEPQALKDIEEIQGHCLPPECPRVKVEIENNREKAIQAAQEVIGIKVAVDCSCRNSLIGVGVNYGRGMNRHLTVGVNQKLNIYFGELYAIQWAVETLSRTMSIGFSSSVHVTILSDSQAALKAIRSPVRQGGQWLLEKIMLDVNRLKDQTGHTISMRWVPGHAKVDENEEANLAARAATEKGKLPERTLPVLKSMVVKETVAKLCQGEQRLAPGVGEYTQRLDRALPGKHTRKLYDRLSRSQAAILGQLRTGKNKLNYYLAKAKIIETDLCECEREPETTSHFLLRCPKWSTERARMFSTLERRSGDLSFLLGGWDPQACRDRQKWQPNLAAVGAVIQFVKDTGRFEEEATEGS